MWLSDTVIERFDRICELNNNNDADIKRTVVYGLTSIELQILSKIIYSWIDDPKIKFLINNEKIIMLMDLLLGKSALYSSSMNDQEFNRIFSILSENLGEFMYVLNLTRENDTSLIINKDLQYFVDLEFGFLIKQMINYIDNITHGSCNSNEISEVENYDSIAKKLLLSRLKTSGWNRSKIYASKSYKMYNKYIKNKFDVK